MLKLQRNYPLSQVTTLNIGGPAKEFISAATAQELEDAISYALEQKIPYLVIGKGSNLLISDSGYDGLIIQNKLAGVSTPKVNQDTPGVGVKSGTLLQDLVDETINKGLGGLHHLTGIPGTVGGAIYGNAGAWGQTVSDHLVSVEAFDGEAQIKLTKDECGFGYRSSIFKKNFFTILEAEFKLEREDPEKLKQEAEEIIKKRLVRYPPGLKCPGSFFKNILADTLPIEVLDKIPIDKIPYGKVNAGYLLESVGAKGQREGNIEVSRVHGNLFVNKGGGKAEDFYKLAKKLAEKVKLKYNIALEPEVQLINLPPIL